MNIENPFRGKENDIQKQIIDNKIIKAKYNRRYKCTITDNRKSRYLWKENIEKHINGIRGLVRLRCVNIEETNKYWKKESKVPCSF